MSTIRHSVTGTYTQAMLATHERRRPKPRRSSDGGRPLVTPFLPSHGRQPLIAVSSHDEALHRNQMVQHGSMRGHLVASPDRVENPPMVRVPSGRSARGVERLLATLGEQIHQCPDDARDGAIVGPL